MRLSISVPLVSAAVIAASAVVVGLVRCNRPRAAGAAAQLDQVPTTLRPGSGRPIDPQAPPQDHESLLERLRQRGF